MPVVPFSSNGPRPTQVDAMRAALPEQWALMAAAQMHSEGRLVEPEDKAVEDERPHPAP